MVFSSIPFLYVFLPCVLLVYFLVPKMLKNAVLLVSSLLFYAWGEPKFLIFMVLSILQGYIFGLLIERFQTSKLKNVFVTVSCIISLGLLGYCKYVDFFLDNFNHLTGFSVPLLKITLPIGISFYTFQILSYVVDVARGDTKAQKNLISLAAYVAMFPQLIAGPIVRYSDIAKQLDKRTHSIENVSIGTRRFILGLAKKVLIANALGELCSTFKASDEKSVLFFWLYAIAYTLHIYFDFSGYSDMAIGLGRIFGFHFIENFNYPYVSGSVTEFWRRWHISLGSWFRDYVYIPLGGNRVGKAKWFRNIFIVWMLTGFWHGAAWNFIAWGLLFAVLLVLEKLFLLEKLKKLHVLNHIYVMFFVILSFVLFDATSIRDALSCIASMFGFGGYGLVSTPAVYYLRSYGFLILVAIIGSVPLFPTLLKKWREKPAGNRILTTLEPFYLALLLLLVTAYLVDGSFNPFLYFRF